MFAKDNSKNLFKLAISIAENFVSNNLSNYQGLRNYDYGPEKRDNVSCLSPFIAHRLILEKELINRSLDFYPFAKIEKFIQKKVALKSAKKEPPGKIGIKFTIK